MHVPACVAPGKRKSVMETSNIRPATAQDSRDIAQLVNHFAAQNVMLPRSENSIHQTSGDWLVATENQQLVGCGALVPLSEALVEVRSLAIHESQHGKGVGSQLTLALVALARQRRYAQVCALTLRENFFLRLGFELIDRWNISPKLWQDCVHCPKFHRCDEIAVMMNLNGQSIAETTSIPDELDQLLMWSATDIDADPIISEIPLYLPQTEYQLA